MSLESHLQQLQRKHEELKAKIASETQRPGFDDLEVKTLKKQKLKLKEQITKARSSAA
ncbi:MAG: DUF465 domain-containing protein [Pseudomonadota bacterium]